MHAAYETAQSAVAPPADSLGVVADAIARGEETLELASRHLDPSLVDVLSILGFDKEYASAHGSYLYDSAGRAYLDFHTGEGFASLGHNHLDVRDVLHATLAADLVDGVQLHYSTLAGLLAEELSRRLPQGLDAVFFASTGAEAVDCAMKFARAATGRPRLISCDSSFHGVTLGPLSLVGDEFFKEGFGPLLPGCEARAVRRPRAAGVRAANARRGRVHRRADPGPHGDACARGLPAGRAGAVPALRHDVRHRRDPDGARTHRRWFALEHWQLEPDFVLVGKALSGGYMPVAAMVMRREIYQTGGGHARALLSCTSRRSDAIACRWRRGWRRCASSSAIAWSSAPRSVGAVLLDGLRELQQRYEMIKEVRASGLMIGIELRRAEHPRRALELAPDPHGQRGAVPAADRDPAAPRPWRDHDGRGQERRDQAAAAADALRGARRASSSLRSTWCSPSAMARPARTGRSFATSPRRRFDATRARRSGERGHVAARRRRRSIARGALPAHRRHRLHRRTPGASGLAGAGLSVRCLVRASSDTSRLTGLGVQLVRGDLTSASTLRGAVEGCSYVVHCGALVSDWATQAGDRRDQRAGHAQPAGSVRTGGA